MTGHLHPFRRSDAVGDAKQRRLRDIQQRFAKLRRRHARLDALRYLYRRYRIPALLAVGGVIALLIFSPWPIVTTLRHFAASPNCDAARAIGLAPALRGEPGYWQSHDADDDGIACEPWPHRSPARIRIFLSGALDASDGDPR